MHFLCDLHSPACVCILSPGFIFSDLEIAQIKTANRKYTLWKHVSFETEPPLPCITVKCLQRKHFFHIYRSYDQSHDISWHVWTEKTGTFLSVRRDTKNINHCDIRFGHSKDRAALSNRNKQKHNKHADTTHNEAAVPKRKTAFNSECH